MTPKCAVLISHGPRDCWDGKPKWNSRMESERRSSIFGRLSQRRLCFLSHAQSVERMKILNVVGARPNFMKIAPLIREMRKHAGLHPVLVHTGQHYDVKMAGSFFE